MLTVLLTYIDTADDKRLFEEMYYAYRKQMVTLAISILHSKSDAEDVVSEVFLRIAQNNWEVVRKIPFGVNLRNYLLKATKNTSLNVIKGNKRSNVVFDTVTEYKFDSVDDVPDDSFIEVVCDKLEYDEVVTAIQSMDDKYRDVLYYHFVLELLISETAKLLNQSVPTTKKQLVRGKKILLRSLGVEEKADNVVK